MDLAQIVQGSFQAYQTFTQTNPIMSSMATATIIFPLCDATAQHIENRSKPHEERNFNWKRLIYTTKLSPAYGAGLYALVKSAAIPEALGYDSPLEKAALGPNLWGNLFNAFIYLHNTIGKKTDYSVTKLAQHYQNLFHNEGQSPASISDAASNFSRNFFGNIEGKEYLKAVVGAITAWNAFHWYSYSHLDESMRTPATLAMALPWNLGLTIWSNRGAAKKQTDMTSETQP